MGEALELTSPCSVNEIIELKEYFEGTPSLDLMEYEREATAEVNESLTLSKFVCVTDSLGCVKYSNVKELKIFDNILLSLQISSHVIQEALEKLTITQKSLDNDNVNLPENTTITQINGLICFVTLNRHMRIPTLLKLQNHDQFLIWSFKKASIRETKEGDGFKIDGTSYQFSKFKTVLAIDSNCKLLKYPNDFFKYLIGKEDLQSLEEIISVPDEMKEALITDQDDKIDSYQKFSVSSLDLFVDKFPRSIYSFQDKMIKTGMNLEINLYSSIINNNNEHIFPIQLKYTESPGTVECVSGGGTCSFPKFDGFKIFRKLSESNHSSIYEAFREEEPVIIKVIYGDGRNELKFYNFFFNFDCEFIERPFKIEAKVDANPAIFMKFLQNRCDLFEFIYKRDFLPIETITTIFLQIVQAVDFLHSHGIIHRDIKDENFLIEHDNLNVKLIDFGSCAFLNDTEIDFGEYVGTFSYAPVEVLKGHPFDGPEQDIWCLGILLYVLCFKEPPFHSVKEILQGFLRLPIERPSNVIDLIRKMIDPKPQNRPNTKMILKSNFLQ